jgi:hypothetical protein
MAFSVVTLEVEDYDKWRAVFDRVGEQRSEHGMRSGRVYQDVASPNLVTVVVEGDLSDLQAYYESQVLKDAMAEAGVVGPPRISFVNEVT